MLFFTRKQKKQKKESKLRDVDFIIPEIQSDSLRKEFLWDKFGNISANFFDEEQRGKRNLLLYYIYIIICIAECISD